MKERMVKILPRVSPRLGDDHCVISELLKVGSVCDATGMEASDTNFPKFVSELVANAFEGTPHLVVRKDHLSYRTGGNLEFGVVAVERTLPSKPMGFRGEDGWMVYFVHPAERFSSDSSLKELLETEGFHLEDFSLDGPRFVSSFGWKEVE